MTRTKGGTILKKRHKKIIKSNKNYKGSQKKLFKVVNQQHIRALNYSFGSRRKKKGSYKKIWIQQINGYTTLLNYKYNKLIKKFKNLQIKLNTKMISKICLKDKDTLNQLIKL